MQTVTYEEILELNPWLEEEGEAERIKSYFDRFGGRMSVLDILKLEDMCAEDKLFVVSHEAFIPAPILHELACVCAEYALSLVENPDPRSVKAIEVKRAWLRGEATDEELVAARGAAFDASWATSRPSTYDGARATAWYAADTVARAACAACVAAYETARVTAEAAVFEAQVAYLIMTLED